MNRSYTCTQALKINKQLKLQNFSFSSELVIFGKALCKPM